MKNICIFQTIKIQLEKGHCGVLPVSRPGLIEELETAGPLGASEGGARTASLGQRHSPAGECSRLPLGRDCCWGPCFADEIVLPDPDRLPWPICSACLEAGPEVCWSPWPCGACTPEGMCFEELGARETQV